MKLKMQLDFITGETYSFLNKIKEFKIYAIKKKEEKRTFPKGKEQGEDGKDLTKNFISQKYKISFKTATRRLFSE